MSINIMPRTAPLSVLCCGVQNGGGGGFRFNSAVRNYPPKREDELDECTELEALEGGVQLPNLETETRELLGQFYRCHMGLSVKPGRHRALLSLQRVTEKVLRNHSIAYNGMVQGLFEQTDGLDTMSSVLGGVFSDGVVNWGRIATVLALGAVVCERRKQVCVEENVEECVDVIASRISSFVSTELRHWFINNNSWDGFVDFFRVEDPESTVRTTLMAVAGFGIGACLLSLMR